MLDTRADRTQNEKARVQNNPTTQMRVEKNHSDDERSAPNNTARHPPRPYVPPSSPWDASRRGHSVYSSSREDAGRSAPRSAGVVRNLGMRCGFFNLFRKVGRVSY